MDSGTLIWGAPLFLVAIGIGALATGRIGLETVLGASDAWLARWLIGALALAGAFVLAVIEPAPMIRLPAIALGVSGAWMIATAARLAPSDRTVGIVERAITGSASMGPMRSPSRTDAIPTDRLGRMPDRIAAPRGTRDLLPEETPAWDRVDAVARDLSRRYAFERIETPLFERVELFARGLGESSDAVEKEMFRVAGAKGSEEEAAPWALRPEPTAGIVRAFIEHGMHVRPGPLRLTLIGPMFRYDRPQAGRYRQFSQWDVEVIGDAGPAVDAELIELGHRFYAEVGLTEVVARLNSIGDATCRPAYRDALIAYFGAHEERLTDDSRRRLRVNPLRVLDDKELAPDLAARAPRGIDHLCDACREHLDGLRAVLDGLGVRYELDHRLVRGLDYYTRTAFEFYVAGREGQQQALGGGGRYDGLAELLGGRPTPGIGFGIGLDRTILAMEEQGVPLPKRAGLVAVVGADGGLAKRLLIAGRLRDAGLAVRPDGSTRKLGRQIESAAKAGARWAVIVGDGESLALKDLASGDQRDDVSVAEVVAAVSE